MLVLRSNRSGSGSGERRRQAPRAALRALHHSPEWLFPDHQQRAHSPVIFSLGHDKVVLLLLLV